MGVKEVKYEPQWQIQFDNTVLYDYNLPRVLNALEIWELNEDCDNNDEDNEPLPPLLPDMKHKSKQKKKPKAKTNKKRKKKTNDNDNSMDSHGNYNPGKPQVYHVDYYESDKSYDYIPMDMFEPTRHAAKFSLPRGVNPSVDNLCNMAFPNSLLDDIVV